MAKKFITPKEVRKGDKVRFKFEVDDLAVIHTGTVGKITETLSGEYHFQTAKGYLLGPDNASIELLDRPVLPVTLPTGEGAVIEYFRTINGQNYRRVASYDSWDDSWRVMGASLGTLALRPTRLGTPATSGEPVYTTVLRSILNDPKASTGFKVLFEGAAE